MTWGGVSEDILNQEITSEITEVDNLNSMVSESLEAIDSLIALTTQMKTFSKDNKVSLETYEVYKQYSNHICKSLGFENQIASVESFDDVSRELKVSLESNDGIIKKTIEAIKKIFRVIIENIKKIWDALFNSSKNVLRKLETTKKSLQSLSVSEIDFVLSEKYKDKGNVIPERFRTPLAYMDRVITGGLVVRYDHVASLISVIDSNARALSLLKPDQLDHAGNNFYDEIKETLRFNKHVEKYKTFVGVDIVFNDMGEGEEKDYKVFEVIKGDVDNTSFEGHTFSKEDLIGIMTGAHKSLQEMTKIDLSKKIKQYMEDLFNRLGKENYASDEEMSETTKAYQAKFNSLAIHPANEALKLIQAYTVMFAKMADAIDAGIKAMK